jgi:hypothetical protein
MTVKAQAPAYFGDYDAVEGRVLGYSRDSQTGQIRILSGYNHSVIEAEFR